MNAVLATQDQDAELEQLELGDDEDAGGMDTDNSLV